MLAAAAGCCLRAGSLAQEQPQTELAPATAAIPAAGAGSSVTPSQPATPLKPRGSALDEPIPLPRPVLGLQIEEHVGRALPLELQFTRSDGTVVQLGEYFKSGKPAVIAMVYYKCPVVCDVVMQKLTQSYNGLQLVPGRDFNIIYVSFDPSETIADAAASRSGHMSNYQQAITDEVAAGWNFHISDSTSARGLADAIGFKYRRLENGQFSHPAGVFIATPEGKLSRYFYGFSYPSRDMKLALFDASNGKLVRTIGDRIMSYCFMFDPNSGKYSLAAVRVMQVSGVIALLCVTSLIAVLLVGEGIRRRLRNLPPRAPPSSGTVGAM